MFHSTLSKYEHQFELELVNEAVEHETDELKRLKYKHRKAWGIPTLKPLAEMMKKNKKIKTVEDKLRVAAERKETRQKKVDEMEPTGMGKVWMTRRRVDGTVSLSSRISCKGMR